MWVKKSEREPDKKLEIYAKLLNVPNIDELDGKAFSRQNNIPRAYFCKRHLQRSERIEECTKKRPI